MKIIIENEKAKVFTPYNADFVKAIKKIGGSKWNGSSWEVPVTSVEDVREIMMQVYGQTDISETSYYMIKLETTGEISELRKGITIFGRTIATAFGRDSRVRIGNDVSFLKGEPISEGSSKNWYTTVPKGCIISIHNVPDNLLNETYENVTILDVSPELVTDTSDKPSDEFEKMIEIIQATQRTYTSSEVVEILKQAKKILS